MAKLKGWVTQAGKVKGEEMVRLSRVKREMTETHPYKKAVINRVGRSGW